MANPSTFDILIPMAKDVINRLDQQIKLKRNFPGMAEEEHLEALYAASGKFAMSLLKVAFENPNESSAELLFLINEIGNKVDALKNA